MTTSKEYTESEMIDAIEENLEDSIIKNVVELANKMDDILPSLSKKELKRLVVNLARFPDIKSTIGSKEEEATETMFMIKDLQQQLYVITLGKLQKERESQNLRADKEATNDSKIDN